nr:hypothetical protein Iba_chr03bCG12370 [Ipomoea batatas]
MRQNSTPSCPSPLLHSQGYDANLQVLQRTMKMKLQERDSSTRYARSQARQTSFVIPKLRTLSRSEGSPNTTTAHGQELLQNQPDSPANFVISRRSRKRRRLHTSLRTEVIYDLAGSSQTRQNGDDAVVGAELGRNCGFGSRSWRNWQSRTPEASLRRARKHWGSEIGLLSRRTTLVLPRVAIGSRGSDPNSHSRIYPETLVCRALQLNMVTLLGLNKSEESELPSSREYQASHIVLDDLP